MRAALISEVKLILGIQKVSKRELSKIARIFPA